MNFTLTDSNATGSAIYLSTSEFIGNILIVLVLGIIINYINATMVHTFNRNHLMKTNPRFILFIHLVLNDMIQLTTGITLFILSYTLRRIYVSVCCVLILPAILTTQNTPFNLACMSIECYIAVCFPFRHSHICTVKKTYIVIGIIWTLSSLSIVPDVFILLASEPLDFFYSKVFCNREGVFRSSYSLEKRFASHILSLVLVWFTLFYIYLRILFVAKHADTDTKKARNTILLHGFQLLLCMLMYVQPMLTQFLIYWIPGAIAPIYFAMFIINQVLPRLISPIVYGLRDQTFRKCFKRYFLCGVTIRIHKKDDQKGIKTLS